MNWEGVVEEIQKANSGEQLIFEILPCHPKVTIVRGEKGKEISCPICGKRFWIPTKFCRDREIVAIPKGYTVFFSGGAIIFVPKGMPALA